VDWTGIKQQNSNHKKYNFELYPKSYREMLSMLETSYGIAVELKEAINALELRGVADE